jgi:putative flippase GtrA
VPGPFHDWWLLLRRHVSAEVLAFLVVGGLGYVVDIAVFNALLSVRPFAGRDPSVARTVAVVAAMAVTYTGNRSLTWRDAGRHDRRREVALFVLFNVVGLGFSVLTLFLSHDVLGLTSRLADNLSANVVGLGLGTAFRFWTYRRFVFGRSGLPAGPVSRDLLSASGRARTERARARPRPRRRARGRHAAATRAREGQPARGVRRPPRRSRRSSPPAPAR